MAISWDGHAFPSSFPPPFYGFGTKVSVAHLPLPRNFGSPLITPNVNGIDEIFGRNRSSTKLHHRHMGRGQGDVWLTVSNVVILYFYPEKRWNKGNVSIRVLVFSGRKSSVP